jgi:hypothetical protein
MSCAYDAFDECLQYLNELSKTDLVKNLIRIQWYSCSTPYGIISYMLCIILLAFIEPSGEKEIFANLISIIINKAQQLADEEIFDESFK